MQNFEPDKRYRRFEDEPMRILITLDERVSNLQELVAKQTDKPCKTHDLRLRYLEKTMWIVLCIGGVLSLQFFIPMVNKLLRVVTS